MDIRRSTLMIFGSQDGLELFGIGVLVFFAIHRSVSRQSFLEPAGPLAYARGSVTLRAC